MTRVVKTYIFNGKGWLRFCGFNSKVNFNERNHTFEYFLKKPFKAETVDGTHKKLAIKHFKQVYNNEARFYVITDCLTGRRIECPGFGAEDIEKVVIREVIHDFTYNSIWG